MKSPMLSFSLLLPAIAFSQTVNFAVTVREVRTLVDHFQRIGRYSVTFDASRLASGLYVCSLTSGSHTAARKMVLMK